MTSIFRPLFGLHQLEIYILMYLGMGGGGSCQFYGTMLFTYDLYHGFTFNNIVNKLQLMLVIPGSSLLQSTISRH